MSIFREEVLENRRDRLHGTIVLAQPVSANILVGTLFAVILAAAVWVAAGSYARVETVPGSLITDIPSAKVVAPQSGIVADMLVAEGQRVRKGDRLLVIDSDRRVAVGGNVVNRALGAIDVRRQLSQAQLALAASRADSERRRLEAAILSAARQSASLREQIALQREVVASNQMIFEQVAKVMDRGFVSKVEYERRRQTLLGSRQSLAGMEQQLTASESAETDARSQLAAVAIEAAQGISQINDGLQSLTAEQARLQGEQSYVVTAPIGGRVTAVATGQGRQVTPERPLLVIVPDGASLLAELYAPSRAIGFVEPGKETRLLYDAFPYQRFGSFSGRVTSISRIAIDPRDSDLPFAIEEPVYRIRVALDAQHVTAYGTRAPLQPGMTLQANIVFERRSFLSWLLQPLNAVLNRNS